VSSSQMKIRFFQKWPLHLVALATTSLLPTFSSGTRSATLFLETTMFLGTSLSSNKDFFASPFLDFARKGVANDLLAESLAPTFAHHLAKYCGSTDLATTNRPKRTRRGLGWPWPVLAEAKPSKVLAKASKPHSFPLV
jgi:hypothetical protein